MHELRHGETAVDGLPPAAALLRHDRRHPALDHAAARRLAMGHAARRGRGPAAEPRARPDLDARLRRRGRRRPPRVHRRVRQGPRQSGLEGLRRLGAVARRHARQGSDRALRGAGVRLRGCRARRGPAGWRSAATARSGAPGQRGCATTFRERFWIDDPNGPYPAIALDADKRPRRHGHQQPRAPARHRTPRRGRGARGRRPPRPRPSSTRASACARCPPTRPATGRSATTAAASGPTTPPSRSRDCSPTGSALPAASLTEGLLRAAVGFDYRMPELHSGDSEMLVPYPAACRPQAWSAAAAIALIRSFRTTRPDPRQPLRCAGIAQQHEPSHGHPGQVHHDPDPDAEHLLPVRVLRREREHRASGPHQQAEADRGDARADPPHDGGGERQLDGRQPDWPAAGRARAPA